MSDLKEPEWREPLTQRETEILNLITEGLSNREIAKRLFLSVDTIKWYNKQLFTKLGVSSRTQAASLARQSSLLESPAPLPARGEARPQQVRPQHNLPRNNLPLQMTSFRGHEQEIDRIRRLLCPVTENADHGCQEGTRLVTLTGPGGVGKTRLAVQTALSLVSKFPDGIWLVDFAPLNDPLLVPQTVAATLGLSESRSSLTLANLITHLQPNCTLLLFDNCEHIIDACAQVSAAILQACPCVSILATSREPLGITGETPFLIDPLPVPASHSLLPPDDLAGYAAISLFVDRARTILPDFSLTAANAPDVVDVCRRLDGLPLAIELAAARVKILTVQEIAARLEHSFHLLRQVVRTALPRAQTLQDCMEWSYSLLAPDERLLLNRLAVFVGGWTLPAAEEVCVGGQIKTSEDVFNLMAQLVEKSLVVVDRRQSNQVRYRFLETIYRFTLDKLQASGESTLLRDKHLACFLKNAEVRAPILSEGRRMDWMSRIEADYDNFRAALDWSLADRVDSSLCYRLAWQLGEFWRWRGFLEEGRSHFEKVLARRGLTGPTRERADLLFMNAWLAFHQGDVPGVRSLLEDSLAIYEKLGPEGMRGLSDTLNSLAATEYKFGEARVAVDHARKALEIVEQIDFPEGAFFSNYMMGISLGRTGEYELAWKYLETARLLSQKIGRHSSDLYHDIGELAVRQGDNAKGKQYLEQSLVLAEEALDKWVMGMALGTLGWADMNQGEFQPAREHLGSSLAIRREIGDQGGVAWCLEKLAEVALRSGAPETSARVLGAAAALRRVANSPLNTADQPAYAALLSSLQERLGLQAFQAAWEEGLILPIDDAIQQALAA